ncbi:MAG: integrin alpha [Cyanobacteria bacterium J06636_16]
MAFAPTLNLSDLDGRNGFVIRGNNFSGRSVSNAGDVNGDGIDDLIIGALGTKTNGNQFVGQSHVIFGGQNFSSGTFDLAALDGRNGFVIDGLNADDGFGSSVSSAGDVNGDGFDDLIIGAPDAFPGEYDIGAGESYVVFGGPEFSSSRLDLSTLDGQNGFVLSSVDAGDRSGYAVSSAGDINGDGLDDLIIGAPRASSLDTSHSSYGYSSRDFLGESYVVFGHRDFGSDRFDLANLDGSNGFVIEGLSNYDFSGYAVSGAGDINGDGIDDLIIGADATGIYSGYSYVVFGGQDFSKDRLNAADLDGRNGFIIFGADMYDRSGSSVSGAGDINGDGIDDLLISAPSADPNNKYNAGESYIVFGGQDFSSGRFDLADLDGRNGFVINGIDRSDYSGNSVSGAGDINGDGIDDLIIGASDANPNGNNNAGESYIVFGGQNYYSRWG